MTGYVYAIESGDAVKIGWALDPVRRLSELNVGSPGKHRLIGMARGTRDHEKELHDLAKAEKIRGEWFRKGRVISAFLSLLPAYAPPEPKIATDNSAALEALRCAVELLGSQSALAAAIGVTQQAVSYWLMKSPVGVPAEYVLPIERATGGRVTRHELRPDIYPAEAA